MTPRRAKACLFAPRWWAALSAAALALAWGADAQAGCAGRSHSPKPLAAAVASFSAEVLGEEPSTPLKPAGCTGAFCGKPASPAGMDFSAGVELRAESWACCTNPPRSDLEGGSLLAAESDDQPPASRRIALVEPPR